MNTTENLTQHMHKKGSVIPENGTYDFGYGGTSTPCSEGCVSNNTTLASTIYTDNPEKIIGLKIWAYGAPILLVVGTLGNVLSFLVMSRKSLSSSTTSMIFRTLAIIDTLTLLAALPREIGIGICDVDIRNLHWALCKWHGPCVLWLADSSAWMLMVVAVERVICVYFPHRVRQICSRRRILSVMLHVIILLFVINCPLIFLNYLYIEYNDDGSVNKQLCLDYQWNNQQWFVDVVFPKIDFVFYCGIPFSFIFITNIAILFRLFYASIFRKKTSVNSGAGGRNMSSMTFMLLSCSLLFLGLSLPYCIQYTLISMGREIPHATLMVYVTEWLSFCNNGVNIFVYCLTGRRFRKELFPMLTCGKYGQAHP